MLKNYLKVAFRYLYKERIYAVLNLIGLAIGLSIGFTSLMYLRHELSYDQFHEKSDQIYRIHQKFNDGGITARCSYPIGPALLEEYSQVTNMVRFMQARMLLNLNGKQLEETFIIADSSFHQIFDVEWISGNPATALKEVNDVVITEKTAIKFFGDENPIGKHIDIDPLEGLPLIVKGVVKDYPSQSHFHFGILVNIKVAEFLNDFNNEWNNPVVWTYITIPNKESAQEFIDQRLEPFVAKYFPPDIGKGAWLPVVPLEKIHLESSEYYEIESNTSYIYLYGIFGIAILILILSCVNYMNLSSARALNRLKEIGMRKVVGANRRDLIIQFLLEAVIMAITAMLIASILIYFLVQQINTNTQIELPFNLVESIIPFAELFIFTLFVGILTGLYPALLLSSFPVLSIMRGQLQDRVRNNLVRKVMLVFQFIIVSLFLLSIFTINRQLNYALETDLGYHKENLLLVRYSEKMQENPSLAKTFETNLLSNPAIQSVASCWGFPGGAFGGYNHMKINYEGMPDDEVMGIGAMWGDPNYISTVGIKLIEGRLFNKDLASDSNCVIVNETLVKQFGWEGQALGKEIEYLGNKKTRVIGVVADYHFESLHTEVKPISLRIDSDFWNFAIRISPNANVQETRAFVNEEWMKFADEWPLELNSMEEGIRILYEKEKTILQVFQVLTAIAIILSIIGLLSQVSFTIEKKMKEVSIRKVLGARVSQLYLLLSRSTFIEILIASAIAFPLGHFLIREWLNGFAYRIDMSWDLYLITLLSITGITVLSISYTLFKTVYKNPVETLRNE